MKRVSKTCTTSLCLHPTTAFTRN